MATPDASRKNAKRAMSFVTTITPFNEDGGFDEVGIHKHMARMAEAGLGVYVGTGGSGEGYSLSQHETKRLLEIAVEEVGGHAPVRAMGVEPRSASQMIDFLKLARDAGIEVSQLYSLDIGHGHAPTPAELDTYYHTVLQAITDLPLVISTHQSVGYKIPAGQIEGYVRDFPNLVGINCSHQDVGYLMQIIDGCGKMVDVYCGGPVQGLQTLAYGGNGFLASEGNLSPHLAVRVIDKFLEGDQAGFLDAYNRLARLSQGLHGNGGIRVTKAILNNLGLPGGYPRLPKLIADEGEIERAMTVVNAVNAGEYEDWGKGQ